MYLLLDGFIKLEKSNEAGSMFYTDYVRPHTLFPFGGLFRDEHYHYAAEALTDIELYYIPMNIFEDLVRDNKTCFTIFSIIYQTSLPFTRKG